eukprot:6463987-Amphidinium_carterae.1
MASRRVRCQLSRTWKSRMLQLWKHWREAGEPSKFPSTCPAELHVSAADREALTALTGKAAGRKRVIEKMVPKRGKGV